MRANRALKSAELRASRNAANAQRMAAQRASLTPEQLSTQRSRNCQAMVLRRELETDSESILRRHRENVQRHERLSAEQNNLRRLWLIEAEIQTIPHDCGTMNAQCVYCKSLNFAAERPSDGLFKNCHKGKVRLPQRACQCPHYLQSILSDPKHPNFNTFKQNIRSYNSALSFASMGAPVA